MPENWVRTIPVDHLTDRLGTTVLGRKVALFKVADGSIHALDDVCSHEYALLSQGEVWDEEVWCPKHGSHFNIRTGAVTGFPATEPVRSYPTKIEDGFIYVNMAGS